MPDEQGRPDAPPAPVIVETTVIVVPFGEARISFRGAPLRRVSASEHTAMPFVIPLETSVVGTKYDSPFG